MKMKKLFAICLVALSALISVHLQAQEVETLVLIDTDMGKIKVKLFNDTPQHRDNFIKNVKEHRYDGLLFHRGVFGINVACLYHELFDDTVEQQSVIAVFLHIFV